MATFKKGDKVLCIETNWKEDWSPFVKDPEYLGVYTVDDVYWDGAITVCEIDVTPVNLILLKQGKMPEAGYWPWHFIKLDGLDAEIAISEEENETPLIHIASEAFSVN